jgi:hypothetical protein
MAEPIFDPNRAVIEDDISFNPERAIVIDEPEKSVFVESRSQVIGFPDSYNEDQMQYSIDTDIDKKDKNNFFGMVEYGQDLVSNIGKGFAATFAQTPQTVGALVKEYGENIKAQNESDKLLVSPGLLAQIRMHRDRDLGNTPDSIIAAGQKLIDMNKNFLDKTGLKPTEEIGAKKVAFDIGAAFGSVGASIGLTFLTKKPMLVSPIFGVIQKGQVYEEARAKGLEPDKASEASNVAGAIEATLERVGLHVFFDVIKSSNKFSKVALRSLSEGVQEGSQQLAADITTNAYGITETKFEDIAKRVGYATALGMVAGAPVSAVITMAESQGVIDDLKEDGKTYEEARSIVQDMSEKQVNGGLADTVAQIIDNETSQISMTNEERQRGFEDLNKAIKDVSQVKEGESVEVPFNTSEPITLPMLGEENLQGDSVKSIPEFKNTEEAESFGESNIGNQETIAELNRLSAESNAKVKPMMDNFENLTSAQEQELSNETTRGQFYREALAIAKGERESLSNIRSKEKQVDPEVIQPDDSLVNETTDIKPNEPIFKQGINDDVKLLTFQAAIQGEGFIIYSKKQADALRKFVASLPENVSKAEAMRIFKDTELKLSKSISSNKLNKVVQEQTGQVKKEGSKIYTQMQALKGSLEGQARAAANASKVMFTDMKAIIEGEIAKVTEDKERSVRFAKEAGDRAVKSMQTVKNEIVRLVKEGLPKGEHGRFIKLVADAKTMKDTVKAIYRIREVADEIQRKSVIEDIKKTLKDVSKSKNIAIEYIKKIQEVVGQIDVVKRQASTISSLKKTQEFLNEQKEKGEDVFLPERILNQMRLLSAKPIEQVETAQLLNILSDIQSLRELGKSKLRIRGEIERLQKERDLNEISLDSKKYDSDAPTGRILPGTKESLTQGLSRKFKEDYAKATDYLKKMDLNIMPMDVIFDMLDGGKAYLGANFRIFKARIDSAYGNWLNMKDAFKKPIHALANKLDLKALDMELIGIYAVREQEGGMEKLIDTGYKQSDVEGVNLNDKQMEFYIAIRKKFDEMRPFVSDTMRTVYNKPLDKVKNYFPFMTDFEAMSDSEMQERFGDKVIQFGQGKRKNVEKGFTEKRTGGNQKVKINAMQVFEQHIENASYLVTMGKDIKYLGEIAKSPKYRDAVGDIGQKIVVDWIDLLARKGKSQEKRFRWLDAARKNVGAATLGFKLSSALIQPTALMDGAALIGKDAFGGFNRILTDREARLFIKNNFPEIRNRISDDPSYLDYETSGVLNKVQRVGFMPLKALDALAAAGVGFGAYEQNLRSRGLEVDLKNPDAQAITYAQLMVRRTQSSGMFKDTPAIFNRGEALTGNISLNRAFLQFQSFVINRWSVIKHDMYSLGIKQNDPKRAARVAFFMIIAAYAEAGIRKLGKEAIDFLADGDFDDDKKEENIHKEAAMNMATTVPFAGQVVSALEYGSLPMPTISAFQNTMDRWKWYKRSKRASTKEKNAMLLAISIIGYSSGVPGTSQALQYIKEKNKK